MGELWPVGGAPIPSGPLRQFGRAEQGSVVLETAIAVPVLVTVGAILLWALSLGVTSLALAGHARDVARAIARGESSEAAIAQVVQGEPRARVLIREADGAVFVSVREVVSIPLPLFGGLDMTLVHDAVAPREAFADAEVPGAIE